MKITKNTGIKTWIKPKTTIIPLDQTIQVLLQSPPPDDPFNTRLATGRFNPLK